jgi:FolB domain-containing protein
MNIQKISLRDIVFSGLHGATQPEQVIAQRFQIDAHLSFNAAPSITSEDLKDTVDYFEVTALIRKHIENKFRKHILLETLIDEISDDIGKTFQCFHVDLSIKKIDVPFHPSISTSKHYFSKQSVSMKSLESIHESLIETGSASTPFLTDFERQILLTEAKILDYVKQPENPFGGVVREELSSVSIKNESSIFFTIADRLALFVTELSRISNQAVPLLPKAHVALQKYEKGSLGITPHRDEKKYGHVICIIPLTGKGQLATCDDREGSNKKPVDTTLGNLILLRAPGYAGMHVRPMHVVYDITDERIVLGVRFPTNE